MSVLDRRHEAYRCKSLSHCSRGGTGGLTDWLGVGTSDWCHHACKNATQVFSVLQLITWIWQGSELNAAIALQVRAGYNVSACTKFWWVAIGSRYGFALMPSCICLCAVVIMQCWQTILMTHLDQVIIRHNCSRVAAELKHTVGPVGKSSCHCIGVAQTLQWSYIIISWIITLWGCMHQASLLH